MAKAPKQVKVPSKHPREKKLMKEIALLAAAYGAKKLYDAVKQKVEKGDKGE